MQAVFVCHGSRKTEYFVAVLNTLKKIGDVDCKFVHRIGAGSR